MEIPGVSYLGAATGPGAGEKAKDQLGQQDFLQLMVAQFQNQDPFKPLESGDFLGQMAQFSTVNGIESLNASFAQVSAALTADQALKAADLVGREALVNANTAGYHGQTITGAIDLEQGGRVMVEVRSSSGALIDQFDLGEQPPGSLNFGWDGVSPDGDSVPVGIYEFQARVTTGSATAAAPVSLRGRIDSVNLGGQAGIDLGVSGIGQVSLADVRQLN